MYISELHIHYLKRQEIDIARWDECVTRCPMSLIYGLHFYLDHMTGGQWDALIAGDYQAVMPLTWRRKYGIRYLAQPAFTQQTGIFSTSPATIGDISNFLKQAARRFSFAEIFLNYDNYTHGLQHRNDIVMSLDKPYFAIAASYSENHRRNLRKSTGCHYTTDITITEALAAWHTVHGARNQATLHEEDYRRFDLLCQYMEREKKLILRAAIDDNHQRLAIALLFRDAQRLYLLQFAALPAGRDKAAGHYLIDRIIKEFAEQPLLLDFEGSDDPGVARFYLGFGGWPQQYFFWRHNRLPWPLRLFKSKSPDAPAPPLEQDPPE